MKKLSEMSKAVNESAKAQEVEAAAKKITDNIYFLMKEMNMSWNDVSVLSEADIEKIAHKETGL